MLRSIKSIKGYSLRAKDGVIGNIKDFYFDENKMTIRYLVVDPGKWLPKRKVLIPAEVFSRVKNGSGNPDWLTETFSVEYTKKEIEDSPDFDGTLPLSRKSIDDIHEYFGWRIYLQRAAITPVVNPYKVRDKKEKTSEEDKYSSLKSINQVTRYHVQAKDGQLGHIDDFIMEDKSFYLRYAIVDTKNWLPGKKVLISTEKLTDFIAFSSIAYVNLTKEQIEDSPQFNPNEPVNRKYEERFYDYYGIPKYWVPHDRTDHR